MQVKDVRLVSVLETATLAVEQINLLDCVNVIAFWNWIAHCIWEDLPSLDYIYLSGVKKHFSQLHISLNLEKVESRNFVWSSNTAMHEFAKNTYKGCDTWKCPRDGNY